MGCYLFRSEGLTDVSDQKPYKSFIGTHFVLIKDCFIADYICNNCTSYDENGNIIQMPPSIVYQVIPCGSKLGEEKLPENLDKKYIGQTLYGKIKILNFAPKGTTFTISKAIKETLRTTVYRSSLGFQITLQNHDIKNSDIETYSIRSNISRPQNVNEIFDDQYVKLLQQN